MGGGSGHRGSALGGGQKVLVACSLITINVVNTMKFRENVQLLNLKKKLFMVYVKCQMTNANILTILFLVKKGLLE